MTTMPELELFELTAYEIAALDEAEVDKYISRPEFRLAEIDNGVRKRMLETMIREKEIRAGWVWTSRESNGIIGGPFNSRGAAIVDAQLATNWTRH
jgi:hypothetical protein